MRACEERGRNDDVSSIEEAQAWIRSCWHELGRSPEDTERRLREVQDQFDSGGTFAPSFDELEHGARVAWRNSNRCIGRLFWQSLKVFDERGLQSAQDVAWALYRHIEFATNEGKIRPTCTVLDPSVRIWNHQLLRYAGYGTENGILGDPDSVEFTRICEGLGWKGNRTAFDILPLVVQVHGAAPKWFAIPEDLIVEVPIVHPQLPRFDALDLKWYAVPILSDMGLEIGGIVYPAAPFNGWYMGTEIGARNLADSGRFDMLPRVAALIGLDTTSEASLWRDRALVELNVAVLHSFKSRGVTIVDHHTAARQFERFGQSERDAGRELTGEWAWLIPPLSPATTSIFHHEYDDVMVRPNYIRQPRAW